MTERTTIHLVDTAARARAERIMASAPRGHYVTISEPTRTLEQNRLMWPLIKDMREQDEHMATFTPDQVKLRFLNALDNEMQLLPELWGGGQFVAGQRSSTLTKADFSNLIELMFKWGAENDILWSAKSEQARTETLKQEAQQ